MSRYRGRILLFLLLGTASAGLLLGQDEPAGDLPAVPADSAESAASGDLPFLSPDSAPDSTSFAPHPAVPDAAAADSAFSDAEAAPPPATPGDPLRSPLLLTGERLVYSVRYGLIKAGTATLEVKGLLRFEGQVNFQVVSTAQSNTVFDKLYPVRDRVMSLMNVRTLYSSYFEKHLREGTYRADQAIRFDQAKGIASYNDGKQYRIDPGTYDVLAAFYRVRTMPLKVGDVFFLESHADRKNYPLRVTVLGREEVDTPAGSFECLVIEPRLKSGAFFKNEGRLTIYLSDDDRRLPVLMRSKIAVGSISVVLTDYFRPDKGAGDAGEDGGAGVGSASEAQGQEEPGGP